MLSAHPLLLSGRSPGKWHALLFCFFARRRTALESVHHTRGVLWGCLIGSRAVYLQHSMPIPQMWSGLPRYFPLGAHDWGQVLMFEGKSCSHVRVIYQLSRAYYRLSSIAKEHHMPAIPAINQCSCIAGAEAKAREMGRPMSIYSLA